MFLLLQEIEERIFESFFFVNWTSYTSISVDPNFGLLILFHDTKLDALPEIIDAVRGKGVDVLLDGGIRSGADIVKALGLGAKMVFIGRPSLWGLAVEVYVKHLSWEPGTNSKLILHLGQWSFGISEDQNLKLCELQTWCYIYIC